MKSLSKGKKMGNCCVMYVKINCKKWDLMQIVTMDWKALMSGHYVYIHVRIWIANLHCKMHVCMNTWITYTCTCLLIVLCVVIKTTLNWNNKIVTSLHMGQKAHQSRAYPRFCTTKQPGVFLLIPRWDASPLQV